jgi:hypothetical protein
VIGDAVPYVGRTKTIHEDMEAVRGTLHNKGLEAFVRNARQVAEQAPKMFISDGEENQDAA